MSEKKQSWLQLLSIQAGGMICLPLIFVGQLVCQKFGWLAALLAVGSGNLFLLIVGFLLANLSADQPKSTVQQASNYFGGRGGGFFASLMIISMMGWFGIQLNIMSLGLQQLFGSIPSIYLNLGIGALLSGAMCFGMKTLKGLSNLCAPLLGLTLIYACFSAHGMLPEVSGLSLSWVGGISMIVGASIAAVIDIPTFFQHAKSKRDAKICMVLLYGFLGPLVEAVGIYLFGVTGGILQAGQGLFWAMWMACFTLLAGTSANAANLYSAVASSYSLVGQMNGSMRALILGGVGTAIGCLNPLGHMEVFLDLLSVAIGSMGAVMLGNYVGKRAKPWTAFFSWGSGAAVGLASSLFHVFITGVPVIDAFIVSFIIKIIFNYFEKYEAINTR